MLPITGLVPRNRTVRMIGLVVSEAKFVTTLPG